MIKGQQRIRGIRGPVSNNQFIGRLGVAAGQPRPLSPREAKKALGVTAAEVIYDDTAGAATATNVQDAIGNNATAITNLSSFDLAIVNAEGKVTAGETLPFFVATRAMTFPASLTGSQGYCETVPTADATFTLKKNGSSVATVKFAAAAHTATFTSSGFSLAAGDRLEPFGPSPADTTLSDVCITLQGTR